ncbi:S4 domain-containing protein YaaA [Bacillus sp. RG28]|uniref:S4 domain-containing protein YaaA n=1 Tax=Gottfriedia endophytica TaxID=2820819 RepID=A0A940SIX7_9BACI|nr:S4 domain-containing protein YaaA [Gottfriedia endophytica]MBP0724891.1 S4 domain-containing protein YaaA [Gottfriedia endophytica]
MKNEKIKIKTEYITLGQFLKLAGVIDTGGMAKWFLSEHEIYVNNELENRRGKKLVPNDEIKIIGFGIFTITT